MEKFPEETVHNPEQKENSQEPVAIAPCNLTYDFSGKTVLVVDDVAFNLILIDVYFRNTGAQMLFAANGREALNTFISNPNIDIVLMDIEMPEMNGHDVTRLIRKLKPGIPVIAITAFVNSGERQRCIDNGCDDFLTKPCSRADMLRTVYKYIDKDKDKMEL